MHVPNGVRRIVDAALEVPIAPSFTRIGFDVRSHLQPWPTPAPGSLRGRVILVTGSTSGLGKVAAASLVAAGATVIVSGRNAAKLEAVVRELRAAAGEPSVESELADMGDLAAVRTMAERVLQRHDRIDVLVHNAGALSVHRQVAPDGTELTIASQVYGPFLLTTLLLPALRRATPGRVITMSSGGMYAANLEVEQLEMPEATYKGTEQYARAKRAQVTLNELWSERPEAQGISFHAMHPGWADTPGVEESLPVFRKIVGPLLRSPTQGADTLIWLASSETGATDTGGFWLDRQRRPIHRLARTRRSDTPERRAALWTLCTTHTSV